MSLTQKIWLLVTIPFVIAMATYLIATRPFRRELLVTEASRDARDDVIVLQSAIAKGLADETSDLAALVESIAQAERIVGVAVYGRHGERLAVSAGLGSNTRIDTLARRSLADNAEVRQLLEGPTHLEHAFPLSTTGKIAVAVVVRDIGYVDDLVWQWTKMLLIVGAGFAVVMLLLARPLVRKIVGEPLDRVLAGVENVSAGKLEVRVPETSSDELGRLARSFNEMTENLRAARARGDEEGEKRAALEARMRHLQTLAAAGEVAASLAHEIGSPLNVILGRTRMMAARPDTADNTRRDLEIVAEQTERITRVVQKLLEISRPSRGRIEEVDVRAVVEETLAFVAPECKQRGIATDFAFEPDAPMRVQGDRDQMVQIVFNLCHNAIQAQPSGGRIEVKLRRSDEELSGAPGLEIQVSDAGPGISPEVRGRIFDPFVTTKGQGGTGLGLAIVDGMVRELGGRVSVDDAPGGGACFRVQIPAMITRASVKPVPRV